MGEFKGYEEAVCVCEIMADRDETGGVADTCGEGDARGAGVDGVRHG
jgi:hypothetical protein